MCFTEDEQNNSFQNWSRWWWLQHMFYRGRMDTLKWSIIATISERKWTDVKWIPSGTERSPSPDPLLMMTSRIVLYWLRGCCLHNQWPARKSVHIPIYPLQGSLQSSLCGCLSSEGDLPRISPNGIRINGFYRRCTNHRLGWKTKQCTSLTMKVVSVDVVHLERYSHTFLELLSLSVSQVPTQSASALHPLIIRWSRILRVEWSN